jgi:hypothetical protein
MTRFNVLLFTMPLVLVCSSCRGSGEAAIPGSDSELATLQFDASFPEAFSYLSGIRELADGKIIAADPTAQVVLRLDFHAGTADTLGRQGAGPQEYDGPDAVFPLPGDSTLLVDLGNGRFIVIDPSGEFVDWSPMTVDAGNGQSRTVHPRALDSAGNIYADAPYFLEGPPDSMGIHRIDRVSGEETPVAKRWRTEYVRRERRPLLVLYDDWAAGSDGRVVVVHATDYSVEWFLPDGSVITGPPNSAERFPVGPAEIEAEIEIMATEGTFASVRVSDDGSEDLQMSRGLPASFFEDRGRFEWPETLPIFRVGKTIVSPAGEAWVHRMMPAGAEERVEVFDDRGSRLGFAALPPRSQIISFGSGAGANEIAYVARTDDMGLVWLERYRITRTDDRR